MKIQQISVFLENTAGRLADVTKVLKDGGVNLRALMVADTADFGILRIVVDNSEKAQKLLKEAGFITRVTEVLAVTVVDKPGALYEVMSLLNENSINIEYMYVSLGKTDNTAVVIYKVEDIETAHKVVKDHGFDAWTGL
jgi:hypothetical protein